MSKKVQGFGVDVKVREAKFGTSMTYGKMKLLSLIVAKCPESRNDLGLTANQKLSWEYGNWSSEMVKTAHQVIDKYASKLPPKTENSGRSFMR